MAPIYTKLPPSADAEVTANTGQSEAQVVLNELDAAAAVAEDSLARDASTATVKAGVGDVKVLEEKQDREAKRQARLEGFMKRAAKQKQRGRAELEKTYAGALSVEKVVEVFDVNVASSAERFMGLIDLSLYTLNRRGASVVGEGALEGILDQFDQMVGEYLADGRKTRDAAVALVMTERDTTLDEWITPNYTQSAFNAVVHAKHRLSTKVADGLKAWDEAIRELSILEWNGKVDGSQVQQARAQERRGLSAIHKFAAKALIGLRNRTLGKDAPSGYAPVAG
jgi:hypothetical protein